MFIPLRYKLSIINLLVFLHIKSGRELKQMWAGEIINSYEISLPYFLNVFIPANKLTEMYTLLIAAFGNAALLYISYLLSWSSEKFETKTLKIQNNNI